MVSVCCIVMRCVLVLEIQHLFYSKENDWGFSNFIAMAVCQHYLLEQLNFYVLG